MARTMKAPAGAKKHEPLAGQTVGPFFKFGLEYPKSHEVVFPHSAGSLVLGGTVVQGDGNPIPDALVEIFSATPDGKIPDGHGSRKRDDHTFTGFGRSATTDLGRYEFWTVNPGSVDGEAPFFAVVLYARGLPNKLHTRIYLPENQAALDADPFLSSLTPEERSTLIATRLPNGDLEHNLVVQGDKETVFIAF